MPKEIEWLPPTGWAFTLKRHAAHECGWTCVVPWAETGRFHAEVDAHTSACAWPDIPPPVETVSD
jgi:hypothetical protein